MENRQTVYNFAWNTQIILFVYVGNLIYSII